VGTLRRVVAVVGSLAVPDRGRVPVLLRIPVTRSWWASQAVR
jgi:hypothetical protein